MRVLITGSSGFIGTTLKAYLNSQNYFTACLVRNRSQVSEEKIFWDPEHRQIDRKQVEDFDAVIHLAGESIFSLQWNKQKKEQIMNSRVGGTRFLSEVLSSLSNKPTTLISASAIGYYGDRGSESMDETSAVGEGFLADVARRWEESCLAAVNAGIRVVNPRIGVVLNKDGGALKMMRLPFQLGLGAKLGNGTQYMSWISLVDLLKAFIFCLEQSKLEGVVNFVAPNPVTNKEFTQTLAKLLHRPALFTIPKFALEGLLGDLAKEVLLASTRVVPVKLLQHNFSFSLPFLDQALAQELYR